MFKKYRGELVYLGAVAAFLICFAAAYGVFDRSGPLNKPWVDAKGNVKKVSPSIKKDTVIAEEVRFLCGDTVSTRIPTTSEFIGMEFADLVRRYPAEAGWVIDDTVKGKLTLARIEQQACPYHRDFRHLGISEGFLAVYEGPMGYNQRLLQREEISVDNLPSDLRADLEKVMDYRNQDQDTQGRLRAGYEFETEAQLNSSLENFDEFEE